MEFPEQFKPRKNYFKIQYPSNILRGERQCMISEEENPDIPNNTPILFLFEFRAANLAQLNEL